MYAIQFASVHVAGCSCQDAGKGAFNSSRLGGGGHKTAP
jgi:hypothetical protein